MKILLPWNLKSKEMVNFPSLTLSWRRYLSHRHERVNIQRLLQHWLTLALHEKCLYSKFFWSVFIPKAGKYGPEKFRIRTLFTQCNSPCGERDCKVAPFPLILTPFGAPWEFFENLLENYLKLRKTGKVAWTFTWKIILKITLKYLVKFINHSN